MAAMTSVRRSLLHMQLRPPAVRQSVEECFHNDISRSNKYECTMHQELLHAQVDCEVLNLAFWLQKVGTRMAAYEKWGHVGP